MPLRRRNQQGDFSKNNFSLFSSRLAKQWNFLSYEIIPAPGLNPLSLKGPLAMFWAQTKHYSPHAAQQVPGPLTPTTWVFIPGEGVFNTFPISQSVSPSTCCKALSETASGDRWIFTVTLTGRSETLIHGHIPILPLGYPSILLPFGWNPTVSTSSSGSSTPAIKTLHDRYGRDEGSA